MTVGSVPRTDRLGNNKKVPGTFFDFDILFSSVINLSNLDHLALLSEEHFSEGGPK
jgi:hypothetical protein